MIESIKLFQFRHKWYQWIPLHALSKHNTDPIPFVE
jgi:hypothetical protein